MVWRLSLSPLHLILLPSLPGCAQSAPDNDKSVNSATRCMGHWMCCKIMQALLMKYNNNCEIIKKSGSCGWEGRQRYIYYLYILLYFLTSTYIQYLYAVTATRVTNTMVRPAEIERYSTANDDYFLKAYQYLNHPRSEFT